MDELTLWHQNWIIWTVVLEKTLESHLDYKEIKPVHPKGNQLWISTGRTSAEAEAPILWLPDTKSWHIVKDLDAEKDWGQRRRGQQRMRGLNGITNSVDMLLLLFSGSIMSSSLWSHGLQHARLSCPSPPPRACSNSCPLSLWCHPTILSSVVPFSSCLQSFPALGSFPVSQFFESGGQCIGVSTSASVLPVKFRTDLL